MNKAEIRDLVWRKTMGRCWYCGCWLEEMCIDHIIPRYTADGWRDSDNLAPSCRSCNSAKRNRSVEYLRTLVEHRKAGAPRFTVEQVEYLELIGIALPKLPHHTFFFETLL